MFDFTRGINLEPKSYQLYRKLQFVLYLAVFFIASYLGYIIAFPHKYFSFSFLKPNSSQNNLSDPRLAGGIFPEKGELLAKNNLLFDTSIASDYSKASVEMKLKDDSPKSVLPIISVRRSYQAFMYPEGESAGFRDGWLLKNDENYYIISNGLLRKFSSSGVWRALGYLPESFTEISSQDLEYNARGDDLDALAFYPENALFRIEDNYYILKNQKLQKFVSDQAYLTKYEESQAIKKDADFLANYPLADDMAGFSDGTLVANADSAYIISVGKILPIDSAETFENKGYRWEDIVNVGLDEISIYEKDKLFNIKNPHPSGTIFKTTENSRYYMIKDKQKHPIGTEMIARTWSKKNPVAVSEKALEISADCRLRKSFWDSESYRCKIPLDRFSNLVGFDYEFSLVSENDIQISALSVNYEKNINKRNFKTFLIGLYNSIKINYAR